MSNINKLGTKFGLTLIALVLGVLVLATSTSFADVKIKQCANYLDTSHYEKPTKDHPFYRGAVDPGTTKLPILYITLTSDTINKLKILYTGADIAGDIGTSGGNFIRLVEDTGTPEVYSPSGDRLVRSLDFSSGVATFAALSETADGTTGSRYYFIVLDIKDSAQSHEVDVAITDIAGPTGKLYTVEADDTETEFTDTPSSTTPFDAPGKAQIDASPPYFSSVTTAAPLPALATPWYDKGEKVLMLSFEDNPGPVPTSQLNVIDLDDDNKVVYKFDLADLELEDAGDKDTMKLNAKGGATLLYWDGSVYKTITAGKVLPTGVTEANLDTDRMWFRLSPDQDAHVQNAIIPQGAEIDILAGFVKDYVFGNSIAKQENITVAAEEDTEPPVFIDPADKPVRFDYTTKKLTLRFNEAIDADPVTDVDLTKLIIRDHKFGSVVVDTSDDLSGDSVTKGFATTVTITVSDAHRDDILKGDKPILLVKDGAVKDVKGNSINVTEDYDLDDDGTDDAKELPVYVTPPLLSGVESKYDGAPVPAVLDLKFTEVISAGAVDWNNITVTNNKNSDPFTLTSDEFEDIVSDGVVKTIVRFELSDAHRETIAYWQANSNITKLQVELAEGAVWDVNGNANDAKDKERIGWDKDDVGPTVLASSTYSHATKELVLKFDETLDLTNDKIKHKVDSPKIHLKGVEDDGTTIIGDVALSDGEIASPKADSTELKFTLSDTHRYDVSKLDGAGAVKLYIDIESGAVTDLNGYTKATTVTLIDGMDNDGDGTVDEADEEETNWDKDVLSPGFVSPAYYSPDKRKLRIRFNEPIQDSTGPSPPDLSKIWVHTPGVTGKNLGADAKYYVETDALVVHDLNDDQHGQIADKVSPLVSIKEGAVHDLAGNKFLERNNNTINYDTEGPTLSDTGNSYTINLHEDGFAYPESGTLILNFNEKVDVSEIDLEKIKLEAGGSSVNLKNEDLKTTSDNTEVKFEITGADKTDKDDKVYTISGWGRDFDTLNVKLEAGALKDLAGNENSQQTKALNTWNKDDVKPEFDSASYKHDLKEDDHHYARLELTFKEQMDNRPAYTTAENIILANKKFGGDTLALTADEEVTQDYKHTIKLHLTEGHQNTISRWGASGDYHEGEGNELWIFLADNAVQDRAGNPIAAFSTRVQITDWRKDTDAADQDDPADVTSASYNANNKKLRVKFDELMDVKPKGNVDVTKFKIWDDDKDDSVTLAGSPTENNETDTVEITLDYDEHAAVNDLDPPLYLEVEAGAAHEISGEACDALSKGDAKKIDPFTADTQAPSFVNDPDKTDKSDYDSGVLTLDFDENLKKPSTLTDAEADTLAGNITLSPNSDGTGGFSLTGADIDINRPGNVVGDTGAGHEFKFHLTDSHEDTVDTWINLYVAIAAGTFKDNKDNTTAAVSATKVKGLGNPKPDIKIDPVVSSAPAGEDLTITASVTDNREVAEVRLYYKVGGGIATYLVMTETEAGSNLYSANIPAADVNNKGLSYYIWAKDDQGETTTQAIYKDDEGKFESDDKGASREKPQNVKVTGATVTLPAGTLPEFSVSVPSKYRMISVPIATDPTVTSTELLEPFGTAGEGWLAWKFTGAPENNGYQAGHIDAFAFAPGEAAWVATTSPDNALTATGNTVRVGYTFKQAGGHTIAVDKEPPYEKELHLGWNQINSPFNFSRSWDSDTIDLDPGIQNRIYWFTGETTSYSFASLDETVPNQSVFAESWTGVGIPTNDQVWKGWPGSLDPWGGYWIYSSVEGAKLKIDPTTPTKGVVPPTPGAPAAQVVPSWSVKFLAESAGATDATKFAGVVLDATGNVDQYDVLDLPLLPGSNVRLSMVTEDGSYLQDMKAPADEMVWKLKVESATSALVKIKSDARAVPEEYRTVLLIDTETDERINLRSVSSHAYKPTDKVREFKLIISKAHPEVYAAVPDKPELLQNYPNPFNPETWIPFKLSKADDVTIRIYNLSGKLVRKIELGRRPAGSYTARERAAYWDGRNQYGEQVASGMYFYHIQSGSFNAARKMVILK